MPFTDKKDYFEVMMDVSQINDPSTAAEWLTATEEDTTCGKISVDYFRNRENNLLTQVDKMKFDYIKMAEVMQNQ